MSDYELVKLDEEQFKQLDLNADGLNGAINKLTAKIAPNDKNKHLHQALTDGFKDVGKWLATIDESTRAGFAAVVAEIAKLNTLPPPQPQQLEVSFVFKVPNNHQDEPYSVNIGTVTDAEGETLPDTSGLTVEVTSSDESVVAANFDPSTNSGVAHFGTSGVASLNAVVKNAAGDILGSGSAGFTVTTGDPAAVSDVTIAFSGLTEEPEPEPTPEP